MTSTRDGRVIEVRVHGVGGATPAYSLHDHDVFQVAGDERAGFFRGTKRPADLEAYSWGNLTAGSVTHALWVLLLPFAMVNLLGFMAPSAEGQSPTGMFVYRAAVRVFGLTITALYTLWLASFFMDEVASQLLGPWLGVHALPGWLACLGVHRMLLAAGVVALVVLVLHAVPHWTRIESVRASRPDYLRDPSVLNLDDRSFWDGHSYVAYSARVHLALSLNILGLAMHLVAREAAQSSAWDTPTLTMLAALVVVAVASVIRWGWSSVLSLVLAALSVSWGAGELYAVTGMSATPHFMGAWDWPVRVSTGIAFTCLVTLLVVGKGQRGRIVAGYSLALLSVHLGGAALAIQGAGLLGAALGVARPVEVPTSYHLSALLTVFVLGLLGFVVILVFGYVRWFQKDDPAALSKVLHRTIVPLVVGFVFFGMLLHGGYVAWAVAQVPILSDGVAMVFVGTMPAWLTDSWTWLGRWEPDVIAAGRWCTYSLTFVVFTSLLYYWRNAPTDEELRRNVGRFWDVATFWPRWFHPLAPPTSCQRAVPDLVERLAHLSSGGRSVILSAHSQGSVLAFAVVRRMGAPANERQSSFPRFALLTHGSPLARIYATWFPHYFTVEKFKETKEWLSGRWINLFRETDPIAGKIHDDDCPVPDPAPFTHAHRFDADATASIRAALVAGEKAPVEGHLRYDRTARYNEAFDSLVAALNRAKD